MTSNENVQSFRTYWNEPIIQHYPTTSWTTFHIFDGLSFHIQVERVAKAEWYFQTSLATKRFENLVIHIKSTSSTLI